MKQTDLQLTTGGSKENRRELDFYPTPPEVTIALMDFLDLPKGTIWEPACGDGAMSKVLESYGHQVISTDIRSDVYGTGGVDYFTTAHNCDAIITNPPFNTSEEFIRKAIGEAKVVAMVLKSQYWHAKKRFELFKKYPPAYVLPLTWRPDFLSGEKGGAPTMECIWTVWDTDYEGPTVYHPLKKPELQQAMF